MKLFRFVAVSLFVFSLFFTNASLFASDPIRVLSINVRQSMVKEREELDNWIHRKEAMTDIIIEGDYDFIGTQETMIQPDPARNQVAYIDSRLPGHGFFGRSREVDPEVGEAMTIHYKKERWRIDETDKETFWLSDTPDVPGSKTDPKAGCTRSVTALLFHELKDGQPTGRSIYVYNTHFDHLSEEARQRGAKQLMDRIAARKKKDVPVIVTGDINSGERSPAVRYMQGAPMTLDGQVWNSPYKLVDTFRAANPDAVDVATFNGFKKPGEPLNNSKIDYIFVSPGLKTISAEIIRTHRNGRYPTDHFPVNAVIAW